MEEHVSDLDLVALIDGQLETKRRNPVYAHLKRCSHCRGRKEELSATNALAREVLQRRMRAREAE